MVLPLSVGLGGLSLWLRSIRKLMPHQINSAGWNDEWILAEQARAISMTPHISDCAKILLGYALTEPVARHLCCSLLRNLLCLVTEPARVINTLPDHVRNNIPVSACVLLRLAHGLSARFPDGFAVWKDEAVGPTMYKYIRREVEKARKGAPNDQFAEFITPLANLVAGASLKNFESVPTYLDSIAFFSKPPIEEEWVVFRAILKLEDVVLGGSCNICGRLGKTAESVEEDIPRLQHCA